MTHRASRIVPVLAGAAVCALAWTLAGCAAGGNVSSRNDVALVHPGREVNGDDDEYAPALGADGTLFFTANRSVQGDTDDRDKLLASARSGEGWAQARPVSSVARRGGAGGAIAFSPATGEVFFVRCYAPDGEGDCDLYVASTKGGEWSAVRPLGPAVNSAEWDAHPTVTADGRTLYFASERRGGSGGSDIWMTVREPGGTWGAPVNLGPAVNTGGDEKTPFISPDGTTLYFSSDGWGGLGGYDIFTSVRGPRGWSKPVDLGRPYNSSADDVFFTMNAAGDTTAFASDRAGGYGGFDVYLVVPKRTPPPPPPIVRPKLEVRYTVKNAFTLAPLPAVVTLAVPDGVETGLRCDRNGSVLSEVEAAREYTVTATAPGFENAVESFFYPAGTTGVKDRILLLTPIAENERKIYSFVVEFDFDLFNIRPEERKHLDSAATLLTLYPNSVVVASGHTDSVGTNAYNLALGYNRAKEVSRYVERYLVDKLVRLRHPIEIRTYGEEQPIAPNATAEGRQRNRRVEIAIVRNE